MKLQKIALLTTAAILGVMQPAAAKPLKFADTAELPGFDAHARADKATTAFMLNIQEALVRRDENLKMEPSLAVSWTNPSPTVYRFTLRPNVKFHDGTPFTADDVVFSFRRAEHPRSQARVQLVTMKDIRAIDPLTVEVETKVPDPLFVEKTYAIPIFSKAWAEKNKATEPVDANAAAATENGAARGAIGTGPFMLKSYEPGRATVAVVNPNWWDTPKHNVTEVTYVAIPNAATRTAALLSGEIDFNYNLPPQDIERVRREAALSVLEGPEIRTIFLAMDQNRDELLESNIKGRNPFKDIRVRRAVYQAIDVEAIRTRVMRNQSQPTGLMWAPGVNGYNKDLDVRLPYDPDGAKKLLAEAGYPDGFEVGFDCSNDRYLNDEDTCKAVTAMLARIGIKANLTVQPGARWIAKMLPRYETSLTLAGWYPAGIYDAGHTLSGVLACRSLERNRGLFNLGGYCNADLDKTIERAEQEMDRAKRLQLLFDIARMHRDDIGHIPLHNTFIAWGMKKGVHATLTPDNLFLWRFVKID